MQKFKIIGGKELNGVIEPQGSKNEALQIVASSILVQKLKIINCPDILDIRNLLLILEKGGAKIKWEKGVCHELDMNYLTQTRTQNILYIDTSNIVLDYFKSDEYLRLSEKLRGSLMLMGPLLSRYGTAYIPSVGGDKIGKRPIDTHINGFLRCGAILKKDERGFEYLELLENNLCKDTQIVLEEPSVTGTANIIFALTIYTSTEKNISLYNIACETYISQLVSVLNKANMRITGSGSNLLKIGGNIKDNFSDEDFVEHNILPDFIEVASFISLAMSTKSEILIKNAGVKNLGMTMNMFEKLGCRFEIDNDDIKVLKQEKYEIQKMYDGSMTTIYSAPWPMISPDILSVGIVASLQCEGVVLFHEKMYEARMFFVDKLVAMKASVVLCDPRRVVVTGNNWKSKLVARNMTSPDIRAGIALLIASLGAEGESVIDNIEQIDRGYENIEERLAKLGANIKRI
jgi:UDP-N-acetylglucosamine 1-carboxyvinyltransferase